MRYEPPTDVGGRVLALFDRRNGPGRAGVLRIADRAFMRTRKAWDAAVADLREAGIAVEAHADGTVTAHPPQPGEGGSVMIGGTAVGPGHQLRKAVQQRLVLVPAYEGRPLPAGPRLLGVAMDELGYGGLSHLSAHASQGRQGMTHQVLRSLRTHLAAMTEAEVSRWQEVVGAASEGRDQARLLIGLASLCAGQGAALVRVRKVAGGWEEATPREAEALLARGAVSA